MLTITELVTFEFQNEHDLEHDLEHKKKFSEPKIYDASGDLSKRWYIYFSYLNPKTGKMKRMKNIYGKANSQRTKENRYALLTLYRKRLVQLLKEGYDPYSDNTDFYYRKTEAKVSETEIQFQSTSEPPKEVPFEAEKPKSAVLDNGMKIMDAFNYALALKSNIVQENTLNDYRNRCERFSNWISKEDSSIVTIDQIDKKLMSGFLNEIQLETSPRNRNNYRTCFSSIFQTLADNDMIETNFVAAIKPLKTVPKRNETYSEKEHLEVFKYLEEEDPIMLLFIKFISYNFLRPIEVCRLKIKDIDIATRTLQFKAKNAPLKTKIVPEILWNELPDLTQMDGDMLLFTPTSIGGYWDTKVINRRDYFSKRFKSVVKDHFGFGINHGLYSFRHTFITKLYRALATNLTPFAAKSSLMQITGHSSMDALEKYLRDIDAELPDDYSKLLK